MFQKQTWKTTKSDFFKSHISSSVTVSWQQKLYSTAFHLQYKISNCWWAASPPSLRASSLHLLRSFLGSLVENGRCAHQGVRRMWSVAAVGCRASSGGRCHGSSWLAHSRHWTPFLEHITTQHCVVMVVVVAGAVALLAILWLNLHLQPERRVGGSTCTL